MNIIIKNNNPQREYDEEILTLEHNDNDHKIILHNDDFNTFDFVIDCLIDICIIRQSRQSNARCWCITRENVL